MTAAIGPAPASAPAPPPSQYVTSDPFVIHARARTATRTSSQGLSRREYSTGYAVPLLESVVVSSAVLFHSIAKEGSDAMDHFCLIRMKYDKNKNKNMIRMFDKIRNFDKIYLHMENLLIV